MGQTGAATIGPHRAFLPLGEAVASCERIRRILEQVHGDTWGEWGRDWLPLNAYENPTVLLCRGSSDGAVPVRPYRFEGFRDPPMLRSIGELVRLYIRAIDVGLWSYSRELDRWQSNPDKGGGFPFDLV
jgi:hypothetical protein